MFLGESEPHNSNSQESTFLSIPFEIVIIGLITWKE
jgi:hypothetical protein